VTKSLAHYVRLAFLSFYANIHLVNKDKRQGLRTWLEIDTKAAKHNFAEFRRTISPKAKIMAVVKSNAYGNGFFDYAKLIDEIGADWLGVDSVIEAKTLRGEGIKKPILIMGYTLPEMLSVAAKNDASISVSNFEYFKHLAQLKEKNKIKIHIKVDTGMRRHGFDVKDMKKLFSEIKKLANKIEIEGLYTHLANAADKDLSEKQIAEYKIWKKEFENKGYKPLHHVCGTGGTMLHPEAHFDLVRVGIGLYGMWPSPEAKMIVGDKMNLKPVLSWRTVVGEIKKLKAGEGISYDLSEVVSRDTVVAVCPIGYWHGLFRSMSSKAKFLVNGVPCKVLGRVCMDIVMIDVTDAGKVKIGDEVTIVGKSKNSENTMEYLAETAGTSAYEFSTRINPLIKKILL